MKIFLTVFITALAMVPELFCGNLGLALGLPLFPAVYFAATFGTVYGIAAAGCAGLMLDLLYNRPYLAGAVIWIIITQAACQNSARFRHQTPLAPITAGMIIGGGYLLWNLLYSTLAETEFPGPDIFSMAVIQIFGGGLLMLLMTLLFDAVNFRCNLPRYSPPAENKLGGGRGI